MDRRALMVTLSWLWLVLLILYLVWGGIVQAGLYYWVGTLEVDRFGTYDPKLTGIVPGLLLALPALWVLGAETRRLARHDPARHSRRTAIVMIGLGIVALAIAVACFVAAQRLPNGAQPALPFDAASLGRGPPPADMISLAGRVDENAQVSISEGSRGSSATTSYAGFRAAGESDKGAPFRIFVERRVRNRSGPALPYVGTEESGYLVENGLPPLMLYALRRRNIPVANPHYLLRTGSGALRDPYYVGTALGIFFFSVLTAIGTLLLILPKRAPGAAL
jgi:hypothetical protein